MNSSQTKSFDKRFMKQEQKKPETLPLPQELDKLYKPGLFMQTKAFLDCDDHFLCSIRDQLNHSAVYDKMATYN